MMVHVIFLACSFFINNVMSDELSALHDASDSSPVINEERNFTMRNGSEEEEKLGRGGPPNSESCKAPFYGPCKKSRYRSYDGTCNNLKHPAWASANTPYGRLVPARYADGIHRPRVSVTGAPLPGSRVLSSVIHPENLEIDPIWTLDAMQWGQLITHDMSYAAESDESEELAEQCCTDDGKLLVSPLLNDPNKCYPILVPRDDPFYSKFGVSCIGFIRTKTNVEEYCLPPHTPNQPISEVSQYMDASMTYGSSKEEADSIRLGRGGRLRVEVRNGRQWPPIIRNASETCIILKPTDYCYLFGDERGNQNTGLTVLQIIMLREHNRIADTLQYLNPHWTDQKIYQQARRICIAEFQRINYEEWLPIFLGVNNTLKYGLVYNTDDYVNDYREDVNPSVLNENAHGALRLYHSSVQSKLQLLGGGREPHGFLSVSDYLERPSIIEKGRNMEFITVGLSTQHQALVDSYVTGEMTTKLFKGGKPYGSDLQAVGIQRARDHGIAPYNDYREFCNLPRARKWSDFTDYISPQYVEVLSKLYLHPDDVDLAVGGFLESYNSFVGLAGPTFLCIMLEQFYRTRVGDRFFYQSPHAGFTRGQLREIRKATVARLICDNGDNIKRMQPQGFRVITPSNALVSCSDTSAIPVVDLRLWKEVGYPSYARGDSLQDIAEPPPMADRDLEHPDPIVEDEDEEEDILFEE